MVTYCPVCNRVDIGKVGANQYYCWHCCIEFSMTGKHRYRLYSIEDDGTLSSLGEEKV
ncbi:hypothetical protein [Natranaerobius thermophilus]|uniref:Insertion element protein n=1 Tax=Natranaerobius thermophilus (strain ATCC BAA-1301 / DSM 18059 / JW/NM-WN-LF) TaxID=457570 RepID=B2A5K0_NATTJ|nr:hypothetical protein [Natranaerobius thermophilus]ACB85355.1 conserved hypothetical protein [Natranaerobius thermophilus JW/NM-WN-LF]